jgi:hypothetical protein
MKVTLTVNRCDVVRIWLRIKHYSHQAMTFYGPVVILVFSLFFPFAVRIAKVNLSFLISSSYWNVTRSLVALHSGKQLDTEKAGSCWFKNFGFWRIYR